MGKSATECQGSVWECYSAVSESGHLVYCTPHLLLRRHSQAAIMTGKRKSPCYYELVKSVVK